MRQIGTRGPNDLKVHPGDKGGVFKRVPKRDGIPVSYRFINRIGNKLNKEFRKEFGTKPFTYSGTEGYIWFNQKEGDLVRTTSIEIKDIKNTIASILKDEMSK